MPTAGPTDKPTHLECAADWNCMPESAEALTAASADSGMQFQSAAHSRCVGLSVGPAKGCCMRVGVQGCK